MRWINIKDKTPNEADIIPVIFKGKVLYAIYHKSQFYYTSPSNGFEHLMTLGMPQIGEKIDVSLWMPLPKPPDENS